MKKIKVLFVFLTILLLSGCTGVYNIKIDENQMVEESVEFNLEKQEETYDRIRQLFSNYDLDEEDYTITETNDSVKVVYTKDYMNIEDFIVNSVLYKELYGDIKYTNDGSVVEFNGNAKLVTNTPLGDYDLVNNYDIPILKINLEVANDVISHNADEVNDKLYTWSIDKDTTDKTISLKFSSDNNSKNRLYIIVLVIIGVIVVGSIAIIGYRYVKRQKLD